MAATLQDNAGSSWKSNDFPFNEQWTKAGSVGLDVFVFTVQAASHSSGACSASS